MKLNDFSGLVGLYEDGLFTVTLKFLIVHVFNVFFFFFQINFYTFVALWAQLYYYLYNLYYWKILPCFLKCIK